MIPSTGCSSSQLRADIEKYFFEPYSRYGGPLDSSGFEHVFFGELSDRGSKQVIGLHNWAVAYNMERNDELQAHRLIRYRPVRYHATQFW